MLATFVRREEADSAEIPLRETASAWIEERGLDLDRLTIDDLIFIARADAQDRDVLANVDYTNAPF